MCLVWPKYLFEDSLYENKPGGTYDDDMLTAALQKLPELQEDNMEKPKDAYIEFESGNEEEDGKFVIRPETAGTMLVIVQLAAGVGDAAARYSEVVEAEKIGGAYVEASMKSDNAKIIARCNDLNDLVGASITYELPDGSTMRLNSDVTKDWLVKDDSGKLVWTDKKEDAGKGLEFLKIGNFFGGRWMKDDIEVCFYDWYDDEYDIRLYQRGPNEEILKDAIAKGKYDAATDTITATVEFENEEPFDVTFSYDSNNNVVWSGNGEEKAMTYSMITAD